MKDELIRLLRKTIKKRDSIQFLAYFVIANLIVAGLIGSLLYLRSSDAIKQETLTANESRLTQLESSIDLLLSQVNNFLSQLSFDTQILDLLNYHLKQDYYSQFKINDNLNNVLVLNNYINSIQILYLKKNIVFTVNGGMAGLAESIDRKFLRTIRKDNCQYVIIPSRRYYDEKQAKFTRVFTLIRPVPQRSAEPDAAVIVNISENYLRDLMNKLAKKENMDIFVVDEKMKLIAHNRHGRQNEKILRTVKFQSRMGRKTGFYLDRVNRQTMLISYVTSALYGWKYISVIPYRDVVGKVIFIRNYSILITLLGISVGVLVSIFFYNKILTPIQAIAGLFHNRDDGEKKGDILTYIENNVNHLVEKNKGMEKILEEQMPVLKNNFITSVLMGYIDNPNEVRERLRHYDIEIDGYANYLVYVVHIGNYYGLAKHYSECRMNLLVVRLVEILRQVFDGERRGIVVNVKTNEIAVIAAFPGQENAVLNENIAALGRKIQDQIQTQTTYTTTLAVGSVYQEIGEIDKSYREAQEALAYRMIIGKQKLLYYHDILSLKAENFDYPFSQEALLIDCLKRGDLPSVLRESKAMFQMFVSCVHASGEMARYYEMQLLSATMKCAFEIGANLGMVFENRNLYEELLLVQELDQIKIWFEEIFTQVCQFVDKRKETKNKCLIKTVKKYINEHYDQNLCLNELSQQVYLSVPYLSRIFREEHSGSIKQYINEVRLEKAKEFLADPQYKIAAIAKKVGYDNVHSFLKLFKEYLGMTPSEYRTSLIFATREQAENKSREV